MELRWANVVAFALAIGALVVALKMHRQMYTFLSTMGSIGTSHDPSEVTAGLIAFGLLAVSLLGLIKILTHNDRKGQ